MGVLVRTGMSHCMPFSLPNFYRYNSMDEERKSTINSKAAYNKLKTIVSTNSNFPFSNFNRTEI